jgi:hypothetical protein
MSQRVRTLVLLTSAGLVAALAGGGCGGKAPPHGISPQAMADAVHAVVEADRAVYAGVVVNRLQDEEKVIKASEHWKDDKALPLPAQMLRLGAEKASQKDPGFTYALLSLWPVNKQNAPKTAAEQAGLQFVVENPGKNYYAEEELDSTRYFTAVYPDIAVAQACVTCHNAQADSPRTDFKKGDVMGGVVVRIPLK